MPKCSTCKHVKECQAMHSRKGITLLRSCTNMILKNVLKSMKSSCPGVGQVLEIGFGAQSLRKPIEEGGNLVWWGSDPRWNDHPDRHILGSSVDDMPFEDGIFDFVVANNSMEHWLEFVADMDKSLMEVRRVMKPGGKFYAIVPINSHGSRAFRLGRIGRIEHWFDGKWKSVSYEQWGDESHREYMMLIETTK